MGISPDLLIWERRAIMESYTGRGSLPNQSEGDGEKILLRGKKVIQFDQCQQGGKCGRHSQRAIYVHNTFATRSLPSLHMKGDKPKRVD